MHSRRIHTVRCSGRLGGEGEGCLPRGVSAPGMAAWEQCVCPGGCLGAVCLSGGCLPREVCVCPGVSAQEVSAWVGVYPPDPGADTPSCEQNHRQV